VLHPDFIERVVDAVFVTNPDAERTALLAERAQVAREIENLTKAIASGATSRRWPSRCRSATGRLRRWTQGRQARPNARP